MGGTGQKLGSRRKGEVRVCLPLRLRCRQHAWPWLHQLHGCSSNRAASHPAELSWKPVGKEVWDMPFADQHLVHDPEQNGELWGLDLRTNTQRTSKEGWTKLPGVLSNLVGWRMIADSRAFTQNLWSIYQVLGTILGATSAKINNVPSQLS